MKAEDSVWARVWQLLAVTESGAAGFEWGEPAQAVANMCAGRGWTQIDPILPGQQLQQYDISLGTDAPFRLTLECLTGQLNGVAINRALSEWAGAENFLRGKLGPGEVTAKGPAGQGPGLRWTLGETVIEYCLLGDLEGGLIALSSAEWKRPDSHTP